MCPLAHTPMQVIRSRAAPPQPMLSVVRGNTGLDAAGSSHTPMRSVPGTVAGATAAQTAGAGRSSHVVGGRVWMGGSGCVVMMHDPVVCYDRVAPLVHAHEARMHGVALSCVYGPWGLARAGKCRGAATKNPRLLMFWSVAAGIGSFKSGGRRAPFADCRPRRQLAKKKTAKSNSRGFRVARPMNLEA